MNSSSSVIFEFVAATPGIRNNWDGDAERDELGVWEGVKSRNVAGVDSRDLDFRFGDLVLIGVAHEVELAV